MTSSIRVFRWKGIALLAAVAGLSSCGEPTPEAETVEQGEPAGLAANAWGSVERVVGEGQLQRCEASDCSALQVGAAVTLGTTLRTDPTSRAALLLGDGTQLWLDVASELLVEREGRVSLRSGRAVVDSPGKLAIVTPAGDVVTDAGSVSLRAERPAEKPRTRVSVLSGNADLAAGDDHRPLAAGESAMAEDGRIAIFPSANLAYQTAWARRMEIEAEVSDDTTTPPKGIGKLFGKNPANNRVIADAIDIESLKVNATVRDRIARTELEQVFVNTTERTLEGTYSFPLPADASVVRFAMEINGKMMEGEILERGRAVRIFNRIVADYMRPKDPALLEWKGGNEFQIRIFPIFPKAKQRIILWYTQVLPADGTETRYTYPLPNTGHIGIDKFELTADLEASQPIVTTRTPMYAASSELGEGSRRNRATIAFTKENFHPRQDFVLEWEVPQYNESSVFVGADARGNDAYFMMVVTPSLRKVVAKAAADERKGRNVVFVIDRSFGTTEGDLSAQVAAVASWLAELGPDDRFSLHASHHGTKAWRPTPTRATSEDVQQALAFLEELKPAGASNLEGMFASAAEAALHEGRDPVLVYLGDGQATIGETRTTELLDTISRRFASVRPTVHAVGVGNNVNVPLLTTLTRRFGGKLALLNRGEDVPRRVAALALATERPALREATLNFSSDAVELVYPTHVPTLNQGEELIVVGRFRGEVESQVTLTGLVGKELFAQPFRLDLSQAEASKGSFVPRVWAQRHIDHMTHYGDDDSRDEIVKTSLEHTVMSRHTAFLVLESDRMYQQYKVDRTLDRDYWSPDGDKKQDDKAAAAVDEDDDADFEATEAEGEEERPETKPTPRDQPARPTEVGGKDEEGDSSAAYRREATKRGGLEANRDTSPRNAEKTVAPEADPPMVAKPSGGSIRGDLLEEPLDTSRVFAGDDEAEPDADGTLDDALSGITRGGNRAGNGRALDLGRETRRSATRRPTPAKPKPKADPKPAARMRRPPVANKIVSADRKDSAKKEAVVERKKRKRSKSKGDATFGSGLGGGGKRYVKPRPRASIRSIKPQPPATNATQKRLAEDIAAHPERRAPRRALVKHLIRLGDADAARAATSEWLARDPFNAEAHWRMADLQYRAGEGTPEVFFGNAIELAPHDVNALRSWARHLAISGDLPLSAAVHRAVAARTNDPTDLLDLVSVEAMFDKKRAQTSLAALRATQKLDRRDEARADAIAAFIDDRNKTPPIDLSPAKLDLRGSGAVTLTWEGDADLDLSIVLPYGERISAAVPRSTAANGKRGYMAAVANRGHEKTSGNRSPREAIVLPWAPPGTYRIEVTRRGSVSEAVEARVKIRMLGANRSFRVDLPAGDRDARVAEVQVHY